MILLGELRSFLNALPDHLDEVHEAQQRLLSTVAQLEDDDKEGADNAQIADEFGDWLIGYFQLVFFFQPRTLFPRISSRTKPRERIINLEDLRLWEIWHTGSTPFPSEVSSSPHPFPLPLFHKTTVSGLCNR